MKKRWLWLTGLVGALAVVAFVQLQAFTSQVSPPPEPPPPFPSGRQPIDLPMGPLGDETGKPLPGQQPERTEVGVDMRRPQSASVHPRDQVVEQLLTPVNLNRPVAKSTLIFSEGTDRLIVDEYTLTPRLEAEDWNLRFVRGDQTVNLGPIRAGVIHPHGTVYFGSATRGLFRRDPDGEISRLFPAEHMTGAVLLDASNRYLVYDKLVREKLGLRSKLATYDLSNGEERVFYGEENQSLHLIGRKGTDFLFWRVSDSALPQRPFYLVDLRGAVRVHSTGNPRTRTAPAISPDGRYLTYDIDGGMVILSVETGARIIEEDVKWAHWSPDGLKVQQQDNTWRLVTRRP